MIKTIRQLPGGRYLPESFFIVQTPRLQCPTPPLQCQGMPVNQILILSNRLPVHRVTQDGVDRWKTSPGGLVSALHPTLQATDSTWIGWTGSPCDVPEPFTLDGIRNTPVALTAG